MKTEKSKNQNVDKEKKKKNTNKKEKTTDSNRKENRIQYKTEKETNYK